MNHAVSTRSLLAIPCLLIVAVPASAQEKSNSEERDLYSFWITAGLFKGCLGPSDTGGIRLTANIGKATFVQVGAQAQMVGLATSGRQESVNLGIGRSAVYNTGTVSIYGGPMVASGMLGGGNQPDYVKAGALAGVRADLKLFWGIGIGMEVRASWVPKAWSTGAGISFIFGGFERNK